MPAAETCAVVTILMDEDLTHSTGLPLLLATQDTSLYPHQHPTHCRVEARYHNNTAAQTILLFPDRPVSQGDEPALADSECGSSCLPVDVVVLLEPTQVTRAIALTSSLPPSITSPADAPSAFTPLSLYLNDYFSTVISAAAEDAVATLSSTETRQPLHPLDVTVHLMICPNCTDATAGSNVANANVSPKEAAAMASAAQSVAHQWLQDEDVHHVPTDAPAASCTHSGVMVVRHRKVGLCATVASTSRAASFVKAIADKRLKQLREDATGKNRRAHAAALATPTATLPVAAAHDLGESDEAHVVRPTSASLCTLTADMIRPDAPRKCEPNDFVKLYQAMLGEIVSVSERRAMAALAAFPTMHQLLVYIDRVTAAGAGGEAQPHTDSDTAVYARNYGEDRRYNVVNEAVVAALSRDYRDPSALTLS